MRTFLILLFVLIAGIVGGNYYLHSVRRVEYQLGVVERKDLLESVQLTGFAEPTDVYVVQSEIPGVVDKVMVSYNDEVRKDQVLAQLTSEIQKIQLRKAQSDLERARSAVDRANSLLEGAEAGHRADEAELAAARRVLTNVADSAGQGLMPEDRVNTQQDLVKRAQAKVEFARSAIDQARAGRIEAKTQYDAAQIAVDLARYNLDRCTLRTKWDGTVLSKNIQEGGTVGGPQLSLSTMPTALFQIAAPLDEMIAIVKLNEADYSRVKVGQKATFKVDAYPGVLFDAVVSQIRNAPTADRTAVTYETVLKFKNKRNDSGEWMVKPRSTVNADVLIRKVDQVLAVPAQALYFDPASAAIEVPPTKGNQRLVWTLNETGGLVPHVIEPGVSDGRFTEIRAGDLKEGQQVVVGRPLDEEGSQHEKGFSLPFGN